MPAPAPEHVAKLCVDGDVTSLPRVMRDVADQLSALDHQYRQQMTALLAMHDKVVARGGELAPAAEESAALRRLEIPGRRDRAEARPGCGAGSGQVRRRSRRGAVCSGRYVGATGT
jgi:hypothetical protein